MEHAVQEIIQLSLTAFQTGDLTTASRVEPLEQAIDTLMRQLRTRANRAAAKKGACSLKPALSGQISLTNFERGRSLFHIAGCVLRDPASEASTFTNTSTASSRARPSSAGNTRPTAANTRSFPRDLFRAFLIDSDDAIASSPFTCFLK